MAGSAAARVREPAREAESKLRLVGSSARKRAAVVKVPDTEAAQEARKYAVCRVLGHSWKHVGRGGAAWQGGVAGFRSACTECGAERTKYLTRTGRGYVSPRYQYPKGYNLKGDDKLSSEQWKRALIVDTFGSDA